VTTTVVPGFFMDGGKDPVLAGLGSSAFNEANETAKISKEKNSSNDWQRGFFIKFCSYFN
jgi:hypothetical protein